MTRANYLLTATQRWVCKTHAIQAGQEPVKYDPKSTAECVECEARKADNEGQKALTDDNTPPNRIIGRQTEPTTKSECDA